MTRPTPAQTAGWRFGSVEVDALAKITVSGNPAQLDRAASAVLLALLRAEGRTVDKDTLLRAGWPGRIVQEGSLAKTISRLRQLLGPDGQRLETMHGYGYRLIAETIQPAEAPPGFPADADTRPGLPVSKRPRWLALPLAAVLGVVGIGLAVILPGMSIVPPASLPATTAASSPPRYSEPADAIGRILWVDDHPENNEKHRDWFNAHRIGVYNATNNEDALTLLQMNRYDVVISDMGRDKGREPLAGLKLLQGMRDRGDSTPFYVFTLHFSDELRRLVADSGGQAVTDASDELYELILPLFEAATATVE